VIVLIVAVLYTWVVVIRATCDAVVFTLYNRAGVIKSLRAATIPVREHARVEGAVRAKGSARKVNSPRRILARYIERGARLRGTLQRSGSVPAPGKGNSSDQHSEQYRNSMRKPISGQENDAHVM
jgi:hypothetical protein